MNKEKLNSMYNKPNDTEQKTCGSACVKTCEIPYPICINKCVSKCECPSINLFLKNQQKCNTLNECNGDPYSLIMIKF